MLENYADLLERESRLAKRLRAIADAEGSPIFMDWPDRWWQAHLWRCANHHVSSSVIKSEALGRDACQACRERLFLTFPEDHDGPLPDLLCVGCFTEIAEGMHYMRIPLELDTHLPSLRTDSRPTLFEPRIFHHPGCFIRWSERNAIIQDVFAR